MSKQDRQGVRTPAELERKYDFGNMSSGATNMARLAMQVEQLSMTLSQFVSTTNVSMADLSDAVAALSAKIDTYHPPAVMYAVTYDLVGCTTESTRTTVEEGKNYSAVIVCDAGYLLTSFSITMGGVDITEEACTSSSSDSFEVSIEAVSGDIVITAETRAKAVYAVTNTLTNCTNSNAAATVTEGDAYTATIRWSAGYAFDSITITMNGSDITAHVWTLTGSRNGTISIDSVTGDIVITAAAYN